MTRPLLKYVGGKARLLPELLKRVPKVYGTYFEPFVGGGALFFALSKTFAPPEPSSLDHTPAMPAVLGDVNGDLIATYRAVAAMAYEVGGQLQTLEKQHHRSPKGTYEKVKRIWNASRWTPVKPQPYWAASFLYLNRTCFNGLHRVNKQGDFNVPIGKYTKPKIWDQESLNAAATALGRATLYEIDYLRSCTTSATPAVPGDFVYMDPPYDPVSKTSSFRSYATGGFDAAEQGTLAGFALDLVKKGVKVMLSNSDTPFIRSLYKDRRWRIERVYAPRSINSNGKRRGKVAEVIITGGYRRMW